MSKHIIQLKGIRLGRGGQEILRSIDWSIASGQQWALIGPNGCGKTTLLKVIAGYEWPTQGEVIVLGQRFGETDLPELRKTIGLVSSALADRPPVNDKALEVVLSGLEASLGVFRDFKNSEVRLAHKAMAHVGIAGLISRAWGVLSQGEKQRVMIARALINRPRLLILDEPCAGLDPVARITFLEDLSKMAARENSPVILFVTHHVEEIGDWVSRVFLMRDGVCIAKGPSNSTMTDKNISETFGRPCRIARNDGYYTLKIDSRRP